MSLPPVGSPTDPTATAPANKPGTANGGKGVSAFADEEFSFWDLVDVINPLQHIPVVNTIYREVTGDKIGAAAKLAGGALFGAATGGIGAAVGAAAAFIDVAIENESGQDVGETVFAALFGDEEPSAEGSSPMLADTRDDASPDPTAEDQAELPEQVAVAPPWRNPDQVAAVPPRAPVPDHAPPKHRLGAGQIGQQAGEHGDGGRQNSGEGQAPQAADAAPDQPADGRNRPLPLVNPGFRPLTIGAPPAPNAGKPAALGAAASVARTTAPQPMHGSGQHTGAATADSIRPITLAGDTGRYMPAPKRPAGAASPARPPTSPTTLLQAQDIGNASALHPALRQEAAAAGGDQSGSWFSQSMMGALDKYEKGRRLQQQPEAGL